jgi:hypothetical protein
LKPDSKLMSPGCALASRLPLRNWKSPRGGFQRTPTEASRLPLRMKRFEIHSSNALPIASRLPMRNGNATAGERFAMICWASRLPMRNWNSTSYF